MKHSSLYSKTTLIFSIMALVLLALIVISLSSGSVSLPFLRLVAAFFQEKGQRYPEFAMNSYILFHVRMPRIILCTLTGIALGVGGCVMQNILRNPLASPFTLGVSSGASFGAALAMVLGVGILDQNFLFTGYSMVAINAFVFGCLSLLVVYGISALSRNDTSVLILTGTAISSLFSAGVSILKYISGAEALKNLEMWLMGGFWGANWKSIIILLPLTITCITLMLKLAWDLNAMNAGEEVASTLGVNLKQVKILSLLAVTLISSITIAFSGVIGFIGLVAPHIARGLVGVDNRRLIPASCLLGAIVLLASDTIARTILAPREIPVGIITALIGVPFFIIILTRKNKTMWS